MRLMNYFNLLTMGKEKLKDAMASLRAREMHKKGELEICKIEAEIAECEQRVQELAAQYPIDFNELLYVRDELALLKRRKIQFETVIEELFAERAE